MSESTVARAGEVCGLGAMLPFLPFFRSSIARAFTIAASFGTGPATRLSDGEDGLGMVATGGTGAAGFGRCGAGAGAGRGGTGAATRGGGAGAGFGTGAGTGF